jgi:hypothetical protein
LYQARVGKPQTRTPQTRHAFDVFLALIVNDMDAVATCDDQWSLLLMAMQVGL